MKHGPWVYQVNRKLSQDKRSLNQSSYSNLVRDTRDITSAFVICGLMSPFGRENACTREIL